MSYTPSTRKMVACTVLEEGEAEAEERKRLQRRSGGVPGLVSDADRSGRRGKRGSAEEGAGAGAGARTGANGRPKSNAKPHGASNGLDTASVRGGADPVAALAKKSRQEASNSTKGKGKSKDQGTLGFKAGTEPESKIHSHSHSQKGSRTDVDMLDGDGGSESLVDEFDAILGVQRAGGPQGATPKKLSTSKSKLASTQGVGRRRGGRARASDRLAAAAMEDGEEEEEEEEEDDEAEWEDDDVIGGTAAAKARVRTPRSDFVEGIGLSRDADGTIRGNDGLGEVSIMEKGSASSSLGDAGLGSIDDLGLGLGSGSGG